MTDKETKETIDLTDETELNKMSKDDLIKAVIQLEARRKIVIQMADKKAILLNAMTDINKELERMPGKLERAFENWEKRNGPI
jgi:hypothetical protein